MGLALDEIRQGFPIGLRHRAELLDIFSRDYFRRGLVNYWGLGWGNWCGSNRFKWGYWLTGRSLTKV